MTRQLVGPVKKFVAKDEDKWDRDSPPKKENHVLVGVGAHVHHSSKKKDDYCSRIAARYASLVTPTVPRPPVYTLSEEILRHYAPLVFLNSEEEFFPCTTEFYLSNAALEDESGKTVLDPVIDPKAGRRDASQLPGTTLGKRDKYQTPLHDGKIWRNGEFNAPCYGYHQPIFWKNQDWDVLHYFFFYAYNGATDIIKSFGKHEADWEQMMILTPKNSTPGNWTQPKYVYVAGHTGGNRLEWKDVIKFADPLDGHERPVVFSAQASHATYADPKDHGRIFNLKWLLMLIPGTFVVGDVYVATDRTDTGWPWPTWDRIVDVGWDKDAFSNQAAYDAYQPPAGCEWMKYYGRWGDENITGPAHNVDWRQQDYGNREWPAREW